MIFKKEIERPICALLLLSLGGWLLHFRIHPLSVNASHSVPFIIGLINVLLVPILFNYKTSVLIAYLFNGFSVIVGTILMAHVSLSDLPAPLTVTTVLFQTTLADILILFPKLLLGAIILSHYYPNGFGRMFTTRWWIKHFCYFAIVYSLGHLLWR